jgi:hypothetical protein
MLFFALFACVQHAYGTRVFSGVTCCGEPNCVCVVTMYRVCVFRVVDGVVSVVRTFVTREMYVRGDDRLPTRIRDYVARMQALPLPPGAEAAELLLPVLSPQVLPLHAAIPDWGTGALNELKEVLSFLHPLTLNTSPYLFQEWFPLLTTAWITRVALAFQSHPLGSAPASRDALRERGKCCTRCFFFFVEV